MESPRLSQFRYVFWCYLRQRRKIGIVLIHRPLIHRLALSRQNRGQGQRNNKRRRPSDETHYFLLKGLDKDIDSLTGLRLRRREGSRRDIRLRYTHRPLDSFQNHLLKPRIVPGAFLMAPPDVVHTALAILARPDHREVSIGS